MAKPVVLYVCHNHPEVRPGGAEAYALELYHGVREQGELEPVFLCKGGPPLSPRGQPHSGTLLGLVNDDPHQYFLYTDGYVEGTAPDGRTEFGVDRLREALGGPRTAMPLEQCMVETSQAVHRYTCKDELEDDQTLLLLRRR